MSTMLRLQVKRMGLSLVFASAFALPATAFAQEKKDCEPGSWFCGDTQQGGGKDLQPLPADKPAETKPAEKPAVVYQPPGGTVQAREAPPPYYYVPKKAPSKKEWGLNLHVGGAMLGSGKSDNAGMGLVGLGLRFRPIPNAAMEGTLDFAGGKDYNGFDRTETAFTLNAIWFLNPKNVVQVYLLGGFGWSWANVQGGPSPLSNPYMSGPGSHEYAYFGIQSGIGLEFRLSKLIALNFDVRGILRGRIDDHSYSQPEYVSGDGRATNTSGAGLFQGGLTFYW
jgi:hypothetical protein